MRRQGCARVEKGKLLPMAGSGVDLRLNGCAHFLFLHPEQLHITLVNATLKAGPQLVSTTPCFQRFLTWDPSSAVGHLCHRTPSS